MKVPDTTRAEVLVKRALSAGGTGAAGFADWLIIDEEWFGPCTGMDTATYERWRRRAEEIYEGPRDAYVGSLSRTRPLTVLEAPPSATRLPVSPRALASTLPRRIVLTLALLLVVAFAAVGHAIAGDPAGGERSPATPQETHTCSATPPAACGGTFTTARTSTR